MVNKVFKLVKFQDMTLLLNIISITLALIFFLAYNIITIIATYEINGIDGWDELFLNTDYGVNLRVALDSLKVMFTICAFVFDVYKWSVFIVATSQTIKIESEKENNTKKKIMIRILYSVQGVIISIFIFIVFSYLLMPVDSDTLKSVKNFTRYLIITIFALFLVIYVSVLIILMRRLQ
jgi:hypothetical protein